MYYQTKKMIPEQYIINKFRIINMGEAPEDSNLKGNFKF